MATPRHPKHEIPAIPVCWPLRATLLAMALAATAHGAHAAKDTSADDLALIEFLGNAGGTDARARESDALWLLDELAQTESTPAPARARAGRPEEKKP